MDFKVMIFMESVIPQTFAFYQNVQNSLFYKLGTNLKYTELLRLLSCLLKAVNYNNNFECEVTIFLKPAYVCNKPNCSKLPVEQYWCNLHILKY